MIQELLETLINGNITDYKKGIAEMSFKDGMEFTEFLRGRNNYYSPEFTINALVVALQGIFQDR